MRRQVLLINILSITLYLLTILTRMQRNQTTYRCYMTTKTISMTEANLISWFNGQINVVESQTGQKVQSLMLSVDRTASNDIQIGLVLEPVDVTEPPAT